MSRLQRLVTYPNVTVPVPGTGVPLVGVSTQCKSVIIQALSTNTDIVRIGDSVNQVHELEPGFSIEIHGDNLDHGTAGLLELADIYINAVVAGNGVNFMILNNQ